MDLGAAEAFIFQDIAQPFVKKLTAARKKLEVYSLRIYLYRSND
jgi:hypothetical protein